MPSRPRLRSLAVFRRPLPGRSARAVALTSGSVLLALCATLLPPPALTPFALAADAAAPWADSKAPTQRAGTAAGREHEVGADRTDATGRNDLDPADLKAGKGSLPLHDGGTGFTTVEPKTKQTSLEPGTTGADEDGRTGYDPARSTELPAERTATSKEFGNPDGTRTTRVYTEPVHYEDTSGTWQEIDTSLVPADEAKGAPEAVKAGGDRLAAASDDTGLTLAQRGDDPALAELTLDEGRHAIGFGLDGASDAAAQVHGDSARYAGIRPGADVTLTATHGAVKETIVLNSAGAPHEWSFPLTLDGLTPSLDEHGAVLLKDAGGTVQAVIPKGWMEDSSHDPETGGPALSGDVDYRLDKSDAGWTLTVVLDDAWLDAPQREYPVKVDPSVDDIDTNGDSFVQDTWPDSNFAGDDELKIGSYDAGTNRAISYMRFSNVTSQLKNRYILNADLGLYNVWSSSCSAQKMTVNQVTGSWSSTTVTWNNRPPSASNVIASDSFAYGTNCTSGAKWRTIDLGSKGVDLVQGWVDGSVANNGLAIWADFATSGPWKRFGSANSSNKPYLAITHSAYGAAYTVGSQTAPLTGGQSGEVSVTVKNLGDFTWEPLGWNEVRLGTRVRDYSTGALMGQEAFTRLNERLTPGDDATLSARIPPLPPGKYKINFDVQRLRDQKWFSGESVPVATVTVTSQDVGPRITDVYPHPGGQVGSLTPALFMSAESVDHYPAGAAIDSYFEVCEGTSAAPVNCVNSGWLAKRTWNVPAGKLAWGKQYIWRVKARENGLATPLSPFYTFTTAVEQPAITSHLGGQGLDGASREVDPGIGNYTTTDTDATVTTAGPGLTVTRTYNSRDPRTDNAFGAGWSTRYDMRLVADGDGTGNIVATLPSGRQVRFGKNPDGSYAPPYGSFSTLTTVTGGGWKLTDKDQTTYVFDDGGRLTEVTDYRSRTQTLAYDTSGELTTVTATGGRALHLTWSGGHVATVTTDAPDAGADPLTWNYTYDGDKLTLVCGPEDALGHCTAYGYGSGSHHRTVVHDAGPYSYWRLDEKDGATDAASDLALDRDEHAGGYRDVQLGTAGALTGSSDTAATFNGTTSYVQLPDQLVSDTPYLTAELWFRTTGSGVLFSYQDHTLEEATTGKNTPALYVGTDGKLRGEFWNGTAAPITSSAAVNDGTWHHAALTAAGNTQSLYLDGTEVGSLSGDITQDDQRFVYLGAGYWNNWPATTGTTGHLTGDIDEAAVYSRPLGARTIAQHHAAAQVAQQLTKVTVPSGRVHSEVVYDTVHDRVSSYTDANGGTYTLSDLALTGTDAKPASDDEPAVAGTTTLTVTLTDPDQHTSSYTYDPLQGNRLISQRDAAGHTGSFAYDTGGFLAATTGPDGTVTRFGNDERGNKISQTTCRDAADANTCHTSYFSYYLNASDPLDPRNDQLTAVRDARSASASDDTYKTTYGYDSHGDRTSTTTPATTDFPSGRTESFTFTDGTEAAVDGGTVPAGLLATSTDARGAVTQRSYTAAGDLAKVTDPAGVVTDYTYDALGRETAGKTVSDAYPDGVVSTTAYDGESRPVTVTGPVTTNEVTGTDHQARTTYAYDEDGRVLTESVADLLGGDTTRTTTRTYDTHGRPVTLTDAEGGQETYGYDAYGHQTSRTMPGRGTFRYTYTALGQLATTTLTGYTGDPGNPTTAQDVVLDSYAYDPAGRLAEHTDAMGRTTRTTYYDDGLQAQEILAGFHDPDGSTRDLVLSDRTYDAAGNLVGETTGNGKATTSYEIDAAGRTTAAVLDPSGLARRTAYTYDAAGDVLSQTSTGAGGTRTEQVTFERDVTGAVTRQSVENGADDLVTTYTVDDRGLAVAETSPRGNVTGADPAAYTTDYTYDALGRLTGTHAAPVTAETRQSTAATVRPATTVGYNAFGETTDVRDPDGNVTHTTYDRLGRATGTTLPPYTPAGATTALTSKVSRSYDAAGNLASETDALGKVTTYTYDQLGNLAKAEEPAPADGAATPVSTFTHDLLGEPLSATDPTGARTEATYDDLGRQITATQIERRPAQGAFTTTLAYDDADNLLSTTSPTGLTTSGTYNAAGDPLTATDTAGGVTAYGYGPTGLPVTVTTPQGRTTRTTYDLAGRTTGASDEDSAGTVLRTASSSYDADGNPTGVTDALGHTVTQAFDALGRLTRLVEPVDSDTSITTTYGYDATGHRTRLTDGRSHTTWYDFTSHGSLESVVEPSTTAHPDAADRTWTTVYDAADQPVKELQPGGVTVQRTFDALGRLTEATGSGAEAATTPDTFGYDAAGRLTSASAPGGTDTFTYDDRGDLLSSDGPSGTATFAYDEEGRLTTRTDAAGRATFGYDTAGRLKTAADPLTQATMTYGYDTASRLTSVAYGATGATRSLAYDVLDRPTSDEVKSPSGTTTASTAYTYDKASRLTQKTTTGTAGSGTQSYGYDRAGRLTSWTGVNGTVTDYTWDAAGNRTSAGGVTAVYDERNRLLSAGDTTYTYSARGTRTGSTDASGSHTAAFDALGRMASADGTAYAYDALGRPVTRGSQTLAYADQSNNPVATAAGLVFRDPAGEAVSSAAADGTEASVLLSDTLHGDVTAAIDAATGTVGDSTGYSPFGEVTAQSGTAGPLGYQGEYTDPDTGQVNMHARWYDPASGGFSSRDSWTLNPVPSINANRYGYGGGDPLGNTDPSGHCFGLCVAIGIGVVLLATAVATSAGVGAKQSQGASWTHGDSWKQSWKNEKRGAGRIWRGIRDLFTSHKTHHKKSTTGGHLSLPNTSGLAAAIRAQAQAQARAAARANQGNSGGGGHGGGGGGGGYGGGTVGVGSTGPCVWDCFVEQGPPPPPPPPPWRKLIKQALTTETARPTTDADVDEEHQRFVDDAFTRAQKDLGLTDKQLRRYFKYFPTLKDDAEFREEFKNFLAAGNGNRDRCNGNSGTSWVYYMPLDSANGNRATGVMACLRDEGVDYKGRGKKPNPNKDTEIVGSDTNRSAQVLPSDPAGWADNDSRRGYQRGHLLARSLGGSGTEPRNLVKLYKRANSPVMRDFEGRVRDRLDAGETVFYTAIPVYETHQTLPDRIELFALGDQGYVGRCTVYNTATALPSGGGGLDPGCQ
ncbi:DNRLRE domain-containing protein [Streptomyces canus]|uniref:DNRLRE domain-containing protein n=1 Tax=Streptomyces canus TaxID=58343 RepID=UPI0038676887|nr:DNRLRE domain-containing protein [Streptomyces canus]